LNIPPSRARRQLAARLALHSKQNSEMGTQNGEKVEGEEHRKNLNPFATEEDDDSDDGGDFTIGDLEAEEEGKGKLPPGTSLVGGEESLLDKNVGIPHPQSRTSFPSMWPFGSSSPISGGNDDNRNHFRGAENANGEQSSDEDSDNEAFGAFEGAEGENKAGKGRRLSSTHAAERRTSLEDEFGEEEDEVVHVGMGEHEETSKGEGEGVGGDEDLVEIRHAEGLGEVKDEE
jgi:hypothetical protein